MLCVERENTKSYERRKNLIGLRLFNIIQISQDSEKTPTDFFFLNTLSVKKTVFTQLTCFPSTKLPDTQFDLHTVAESFFRDLLEAKFQTI